jgi:hypothetical protein
VVVCEGAQFATSLFVFLCLSKGEVRFGCGEPLAWLFREGAQFVTSLFVLLCLSEGKVRFGMRHAHAM